MNFTRTDFPSSLKFGLSSTETGADLDAAGFDCVQVLIPWRDDAVLDHCKTRIDSVLEHGARPCAVLNQSSLPLHAIDRGGWSNRDTAIKFAEFSETVMQQLGDRLYSVATSPGHFETRHVSTRSEVRGLHHQLLAHGMAVQAMRGFGMANIGIELDSGVAQLASSCVFHGAYPADWLKQHQPHLPDHWDQDLSVIAARLDWCGVALDSADGLDILTTLPQDLPTQVTVEAADEASLAIQLNRVRTAVEQGSRLGALILKSESRPLINALCEGLNHGGMPAPWTQPAATVRAHWNLVADIGGTNTRLGVISDGELTSLHKHPTGSLADLHAALHDVRVAQGTPPRAVVAAGAGPVRDGTIHLTNAHLKLSEAELAEATESDHTFVINDFTAAAWSVAEVTGTDVEPLQGAASPPLGTRLVVGPGTGLGVGALIYSEGHFHTASGEGGHMGLSPRHKDEVEVFAAAKELAPECFFGDSLVLEAEMFLSGTGLPILYQAVGLASGQNTTAVRTAKDILQAAQDGTDTCAVKTARMFTEHLGAIMGDLAVALVPRGGVFLVGGVAEKNRWLFDQDFLNAFNAGGRFSGLREEMNLYISRQDEFGIVGANNFCKNALIH